MSDTDTKPTPPRRPRRRFRRLIGIAATVSVLALITALTLWAARPKWHTFVSKPAGMSPRYALEFRVPVGWECQEGLSVPPGDIRDIRVHLRRKPLPGFARWWSEHVFRLHDGQQSHEDYYICLSHEPADEPMWSTAATWDEIIRSIRVVQK